MTASRPLGLKKRHKDQDGQDLDQLRHDSKGIDLFDDPDRPDCDRARDDVGEDKERCDGEPGRVKSEPRVWNHERNRELMQLYAGMNTSMDQLCDTYTDAELELLADFLRRVASAGLQATEELAPPSPA